MTVMAETVVVTRVYEKGVCVYAEGKVLKNGSWLNAAFTSYKPDVYHMNRDEMFAYAAKRLPEFTEDHNWLEEAFRK